MLQNKIITSCLLLLIAVGGFFGSIESKNTISGNVAYATEFLTDAEFAKAQAAAGINPV
jgi:hypothetical protein